MVTINGLRTTAMTPWQWLEDWQRSDLTDEQRSFEYIRTEMQHRYPGPYRVVKIWNPKCRTNLYGVTYTIKFDSPQEETMFRLKYS